MGATTLGLAGGALAQSPLPGEVGQTGAVVTVPQQPGIGIPALGNPPANPANAPAATAEGAEQGTSPGRRPFSIVPRITVAETFTDNVAPTSGIKRSDQVTELSPGIRIDSYGARANFFLDYQLRHLLYAQESGRKNTQNYLNSFGTFQAVENRLFIDVSGVVAQQEISPFSFQSASNTTVNPNRVETSTFRVSPYLKGELAGAADYELRYNRVASRSNSAFVGDVDVDEWRGNLKGHTPLAALDWGLEGNRRNIDFHGGRNNEEERFRGLLGYRIIPDLKLTVSAGQEANDFNSANKETHNTHGYGFDWQPSERTRVNAFRERRFFGDGHAVSVSHRTALTSLRFTDTRDVAVLPGRFATVGFGTVHELLSNQYATRIPDPVERTRYVDGLLQQFGIAPDLLVTRGFLTSRVSVERRQELSYAIQWVRDILTLSAVRTENEGVGLGGTDVFTNARSIRQRGFSVSYAHRLTPLSTLNVVANKQNSEGNNGAALTSQIRSLHVSVATKLSPKTSASLGLRRTLFDSNTQNDYAENAVIGALTAQF